MGISNSGEISYATGRRGLIAMLYLVYIPSIILVAYLKLKVPLKFVVGGGALINLSLWSLSLKDQFIL